MGDFIVSGFGYFGDQVYGFCNIDFFLWFCFFFSFLTMWKMVSSKKNVAFLGFEYICYVIFSFLKCVLHFGYYFLPLLSGFLRS